MIPIVDAHHHIWRQADLPWLQGPMLPRIFGPYEPIRRDYPIAEFLADIASSGVEKSVYVQCNWAKDKAVDEVAWVQGIADEHGWPHAIVGYADLLSDDVAATLKRQAKFPLMRGIRMQLHWHENEMYRFAASPDLMSDSRLRKNIRLLADYGWSFDLQVFASQMADAARLAADNPDITFILQHAGMLEDLSPQGRARVARGHEAARRPAEYRLEAFRPRHLHPPQRRGAYRRYRRRNARNVRRRTLPLRQQFSDRKAVDQLCRSGDRIPQGARLIPRGDAEGGSLRNRRCGVSIVGWIG